MTHQSPRFLDRSTPPTLLTLILISGVSAMSMNVFLPSLPNMTAYFDADYRMMQLSVSVYLLFSAVLQLIIGPLSDRFGRRRILIVSGAIFTVASLGTLIAPNATVFLAFRMLQASIATAMALSRAVVRDMVDETRAASMIAYVTLGMSVVPMIGPVIGGLLDERFGWKASFAMLAILGFLVTALIWADLGETVTRQKRTLREQVSEYPELLTSPRFWGYVLSTAFASGVFFAFLGGAAFVGSVIYGLSPSELGLFFGVSGVGYGFGNFLSGRYSTRFGVIRMILAGNATMVVGMALQFVGVLGGIGGALGFFMPFLLIGVGNGLVLPNSNAGMLSVRPSLAGTASGLGGAIMIGGGAALSALAGSLLTEETGAWPLLMVLASSLGGSILAILVVIWRTRQIAG